MINFNTSHLLRHCLSSFKNFDVNNLKNVDMNWQIPLMCHVKYELRGLTPKKQKIQLKHHHNHQRQQENEYSCHGKIDVTIICHFKIFYHNSNVPSSSCNIFLRVVLFSLCLVNIQKHSAAFNIYILDWNSYFQRRIINIAKNTNSWKCASC